MSLSLPILPSQTALQHSGKFSDIPNYWKDYYYFTTRSTSHIYNIPLGNQVGVGVSLYKGSGRQVAKQSGQCARGIPVPGLHTQQVAGKKKKMKAEGWEIKITLYRILWMSKSLLSLIYSASHLFSKAENMVKFSSPPPNSGTCV